ncbi:MAG: response regulator transcription factor [Alphaproteobacteria bacterium]|nr:response regulator transcription factor [Alphaproteobacteria bacterium]
MSDTIRVAVIDDHPMLREGVVRTLQDAGMEICGEGDCKDSAVKLAIDELPDVMLLDMNMPGSGLSAIDEISRRAPAVRVIMLTVREDHDAVTAALRLGARGYVLKGVSSSQLIEIVRSVHDGGSYVSPALAAKLLVDLDQPTAEDGHATLEQLSQREVQILKLIGKGLSNKEIGGSLDIKEKTVKHYVTNILQKLQLRNRTEAAIFLQSNRSN